MLLNGKEYKLKVNLSCGDEEEYIIVYLGCYDYCKNYVCEATDKEEKEESDTSTESPAAQALKHKHSNVTMITICFFINFTS